MSLLGSEAGLPGGGIGILILLLAAVVVIAIAALAIGGVLTAVIVVLIPPRKSKSAANIVASDPQAPRPAQPVSNQARQFALIFLACLLLATLPFAIGWYVSIQPSRDYSRLQAAGFEVRGDLNAEPAPWLQRKLAEVEPRPWEALTERGTVQRELSATELAQIISRHSDLNDFYLQAQGCQAEVLRAVNNTPDINSIHLESREPIDHDWVSNMPPSSKLQRLEFRAPGLKPAEVIELLRRCPQIYRLDAPLSAIDEAACTAIIEKSSLTQMHLFVLKGDSAPSPEQQRVWRTMERVRGGKPLPEDIIGRLRKHFPPSNFKVLGPSESE